MIDIIQFIEWVKTHVDGEFYPLYFPDTASDDCVAVNFSEVLGRQGTVKDMTCSFLVRASHPKDAIKKCGELINNLDKKTNLVFGNIQIILLLAQQGTGQFQGIDDNSRSVFQADFKMLVSRTDILN